MRAFLVAVVLSILAGCAPPHYDLSEPIYLVPEESFWQGCNEDPDGYMACMAERQAVVYHGLDMWLQHFDEATRPLVIMVWPEESVPDGAKNEPIKLAVSAHSHCKGDNWVGCYDWYEGPHPKIIFRRPDNITSFILAHEFGHALGVIEHVKGRLSIMATPIDFYVNAEDVVLMCATNGTCPAHDEVWWEGSFYDVCRCPSSSPEDGVAKLASGEIVCI